MYHIFFIHSSVDGHLGYLHVLVIVTSAVVNIGCRNLLELWFSLDICPEVELMDHVVVVVVV